MASWRVYGSSGLAPFLWTGSGYIKDNVLALGGNNAGTVSQSVDISVAATSWTTAWTGGTLNTPRWFANYLIGADGKSMVFGGKQTVPASPNSYSCVIQPANNPEVLEWNLTWRSLLSTGITRDYHSVALLLPSGKVFNCGGNNRHNIPNGTCTPTQTQAAADYQVFVPPSLNCGAYQPVLTNPSATGPALAAMLGAGATLSIQALPAGESIVKVHLVRPGSVTHHHDPNARSVELPFQQPNPTTLTVTLPAQAEVLPRGYYMVFLVTANGANSEAGWVLVQ